jgi:hypothetical protein
LAKFQFVEINGMKLTEPNQAYSILWDCLQPSDGESTTKKKRVTANHALELLENMYNTHNEERQTT